MFIHVLEIIPELLVRCIRSIYFINIIGRNNHEFV